MTFHLNVHLRWGFHSASLAADAAVCVSIFIYSCFLLSWSVCSCKACFGSKAAAWATSAACSAPAWHRADDVVDLLVFETKAAPAIQVTEVRTSATCFSNNSHWLWLGSGVSAPQFLVDTAVIRQGFWQAEFNVIDAKWGITGEVRWHSFDSVLFFPSQTYLMRIITAPLPRLCLCMLFHSCLFEQATSDASHLSHQWVN